MPVYSLSKHKLPELILSCMKTYEIIGPVQKENYRSYERITDPNTLVLEGNTYVPAKPFFLPPREELFRFEDGAFIADRPAINQRIFIGIKLCDLNSIKKHDMLFVNHYQDEHFKMLLEKTLFIGYLCRSACSEYAFCGSLDLQRYYDLMIIEEEQQPDVYFFDAGSKKGEQFIKQFQKFFTQENKTFSDEIFKMKFADRLHTLDISKTYDHPDWEKGVSQCLSCGACTSLCPSCYCFELKDEPSLQKPGVVSKIKELSSCQVESFSRVAGDFVFRKERKDRFKHRIYHQLDYFKKRYGENLCTGCGRCISYCPTRIDFVTIINEMK